VRVGKLWKESSALPGKNLDLLRKEASDDKVRLEPLGRDNVDKDVSGEGGEDDAYLLLE
jgi:hypothetical protein